MSKTEYLSAPRASKSMPMGIPYIVANEAAERFSFYGMKAVLFVYMTKFLCDQSGLLSPMKTAEATANVHYFVFAVYFFPVVGALISDLFFGKYRTILYLSIVYCLGHFVLAIGNHDLGYSDRDGLFWGLILIAIGAGAIKSCVSAHVGDQFGSANKHLMSKVFGWFYFSINLGAFLSTLITPWLLNDPYLTERGLNVHLAFGIPGVLMAIATFFFWMGRHKFVHIPAKGTRTFQEAFSGEGLKSILNLLMIYAFVAVFWSLFDQTASKWIDQAAHMNRTIAGRELLPSQIQAANPILILLLIPVFSYIIYPALNRIFPLTPLRKISIGFFITVIAFSISALIETRIDAGETPHILWQIVAYAVLTAAEVMVSITCLEFSYTQAPKTMKSIIMALYLLSVAAGNLLTAGVNVFIQNDDGSSKLEGASYYWFFAGLMFVAAVVFVGVSQLYRGRSYIQDDGETVHVPETDDEYLSCPQCGQLNEVGRAACDKCGEMLALHVSGLLLVNCRHFLFNVGQAVPDRNGYSLFIP